MFGDPLIKNYICIVAHTSSGSNFSTWSSSAATTVWKDIGINIMTYIEIVGNGYYNNRSNARALDWNGNEYLMGDIYVGCGADSTGGSKLAKVSEIPDITPLAPKASPEFTGSISLGRKENTTIGINSIALGYNTTASGSNSQAFGSNTVADGSYTHAEGYGSDGTVTYNSNTYSYGAHG